MDKKIKSICVSFENCEGIKIGARDIKRFRSYEGEILLDVVDNGNSEYTSTWSDNSKSPLQRLTDYNDITSIEVCYEDDTNKMINPEWYYENEWHTPQENKYQINKVIDYKNRTILISKEQYINNRREELNNIIKEAQEELDMLPSRILMSDIVDFY